MLYKKCIKESEWSYILYRLIVDKLYCIHTCDVPKKADYSPHQMAGAFYSGIANITEDPPPPKFVDPELQKR